MLHKALHCYSNLGLFDIRTHGANPLGIHINLISVHDSGSRCWLSRAGESVSSDPEKWQPVHRVPPVQGIINRVGRRHPCYIYDAQRVARSPRSYRGAAGGRGGTGVSVPIDNIGSSPCSRPPHRAANTGCRAYTDLSLRRSAVGHYCRGEVETGDDGIDAID